jgi:hypothetical protein
MSYSIEMEIQDLIGRYKRNQKESRENQRKYLGIDDGYAKVIDTKSWEKEVLKEQLYAWFVLDLEMVLEDEETRKQKQLQQQFENNQ